MTPVPGHHAPGSMSKNSFQGDGPLGTSQLYQKVFLCGGEIFGDFAAQELYRVEVESSRVCVQGRVDVTFAALIDAQGCVGASMVKVESDKVN